MSNNKKHKLTALFKNYYVVYTVLFSVVCTFVFLWHIVLGKTLIWNSDGWNQHYPALIYYGKYLRSILRNLFTEHRLVIPDWDFSIGEGSDVVSTLHYYVIGEPINLLSALVPVRYTHYLYSALIVLRLYLSGIAFSILCFQTEHRNRYANLTGAFSYAFCTWALFNSQRHPYFLTPMIWLPLLILGVEKVLKKKRPYLLIGAVTLAGVSNFYYFYMLVLLVVLYCVIRAFDLYGRRWKEIGLAALHVAIPSVIGAMNAAIILIPIIFVFLGDTRMGIEHDRYLFYPLKYYSTLFSAAISDTGSFWMYGGYSAPVLLSVFLMLRDKKRAPLLKKLFFSGIVIILFPMFGQVLCGLSYRCNRWCYAMALLCCYILTEYWEELTHITMRELRYLGTCLAVFYGALMLCENSRIKESFAAIGIACFALILLIAVQRIQRKEWGLLFLAALCVIGNSFWMYAPSEGDYVSEAVSVSEAEDYLLNETMALKGVAETEEVNYSTNAPQCNCSILSDYSTDNCFWSLNNPFLTQYYRGVSLNNKILYVMLGYDSRTALLGLASKNYFVLNGSDTSYVPYGYEPVDTINVKKNETKEQLQALQEELGTSLTRAQRRSVIRQTKKEYQVYENSYALPLGYCYSSYITGEEWDSLSAAERQEVMLTTVMLSEESTLCPGGSTETDVEVLPYTVECDSPDIVYEDGRIVTTKNNQSITLTFDSAGDAETYLNVTGLDFSGSGTYDLYLGGDEIDPNHLYNQVDWNLLSSDEREQIRRENVFWESPNQTEIKASTSAKVTRAIGYATANYNFYCGVHDYTANLGYQEEAVTSIQLTFKYQGIYTFDSLEVLRIPMDGYAEKIHRLKENTLTDVKKGTDTVTGSIALEEPKILCISIPYSEGWKACLDGEEVPVMIANGHYIGLDIPAGEHTVKLTYSLPYKKLGAAVSLAGFLLTILCVIRGRRRRRVSR